jgi:hypothetical protein
VSSGQTWYLTSNNATAVSAFQMYEFHTVQKGTSNHAGQTVDVDYSVTQVISARNDLRLQVGLVGYGQWQTTARSGPSVTLDQAHARYSVNALGFALNVFPPQGTASLGVKYFKEFGNRSTFQGYAVQISGSIGF